MTNIITPIISLDKSCLLYTSYAGVSTAILIFTKTNGTGTDKVLFYDMKADGYSLDDKRQPVQENDIPDIIERFHKKENEEDRAVSYTHLIPDMLRRSKCSQASG